MTPDRFFKEILAQTLILKRPKRRLSTFGQTKIDYFFLSEIKGFKDRSRLRKGVVVAEKPKIITAETWKQRFEGFGKEAQSFGQWLFNQYGESFRALEYQFRNTLGTAAVEHSSIKLLAEQIEKRTTEDQFSQSAVIRGPDGGWQVSLMKFILDECSASFYSNMKELDEHGMFDSPEKVMKNRRRTIEELLKRCRKDKALVPFLGQKLKEFQLFEEYQDRFFDLMKQ